jgi:hypothetical protein
MDDLGTRVLLTVNVVVPLVLFMAAIYLGLHILLARLIPRVESPVLWFFGVVTGPLTRPIRPLLPAGTPERRVRAVSFVVYVLLWLAVRAAFVGMGLPRPG